MSQRPPELAPLIDALYATFRVYPPFGAVCLTCFDNNERAYFRETPLAKLTAQDGVQLLQESYPHMWDTPDQYRYHLPRILECLAPPERADDLYPLHLAETMHRAGFPTWPDAEREAVLTYLEAVTPHLGFEPTQDLPEWEAGMRALREGVAPPTEEFYPGV